MFFRQATSLVIIDFAYHKPEDARSSSEAWLYLAEDSVTAADRMLDQIEAAIHLLDQPLGQSCLTGKFSRNGACGLRYDLQSRFWNLSTGKSKAGMNIRSRPGYDNGTRRYDD